MYIDDDIFRGSTDSELTQSVKTLQQMGLDIEDQGHHSDYVGVNIEHFKYTSYEFTQQALIEAILYEVGTASSCKIKCIPMSSSKYLHSNTNSIPFYEASFDFNCHYVTGKLNYLFQNSRPDIIFVLH